LPLLTNIIILFSSILANNEHMLHSYYTRARDAKLSSPLMHCLRPRKHSKKNWMALNNFECNQLMPLHFKGLTSAPSLSANWPVTMSSHVTQVSSAADGIICDGSVVSVPRWWLDCCYQCMVSWSSLALTTATHFSPAFKRHRWHHYVDSRTQPSA